MKSLLNRLAFPCLALAICLPAESQADSTAILDIAVRNPLTAPSMRVPIQGTYTLAFHGRQARILFPDGSFRIIDFDKKLVSIVDPSQKSFYQLSLDAFLTFGEKLPSQYSIRFSEETTKTFGPTQGQESRPVLSRNCQPFNVDLEARLSRSASTRSNGFGGRRHGGSGGGGFPGDPSGGVVVDSAGVTVAGEIWATPFLPSDGDLEEITTAELSVMMRNAPGLKDLVAKVRKTNSTLLASTTSVSILDKDGLNPQQPPVVSAEIKSITPGPVDPATFLIPADYIKVQPPAFPLGSYN